MKKVAKKKPLQSRSQLTVNTILEATTRILGRDGLKALNTNKISEVAGVSVGSVYQFFSNKDSIIEELVTRALDRNLEDLMKLLDEPTLPGLRPFLTRLVDGIFDHFEKRGVVANILLERAPQLIGLRRFQKIDEKIIPLIMKKMKEQGIQIRSQDPEVALFVVNQAIRGVVSMTFTGKKARADKDKIKRELVDLCVRYLEPSIV